MRAPHFALGCLLLAAGCGGGSTELFDHAPVSGTVTIDGQPLVGATVYFNPTEIKQGASAGSPSMGKTDMAGKYTLNSIRGQPGAVIGPHSVSVTTLEMDDNLVVTRKEECPKRYNENSELTFTVTAEGSTQADFALTSDKSKKPAGS